jgi:hypothetical protein
MAAFAGEALVVVLSLMSGVRSGVVAEGGAWEKEEEVSFSLGRVGGIGAVTGEGCWSAEVLILILGKVGGIAGGSDAVPLLAFDALVDFFEDFGFEAVGVEPASGAPAVPPFLGVFAVLEDFGFEAFAGVSTGPAAGLEVGEAILAWNACSTAALILSFTMSVGGGVPVILGAGGFDVRFRLGMAALSVCSGVKRRVEVERLKMRKEE